MSADFVPFIAHTVLPAASLDAALTGVDTEAQLGVTDAQAASTAAAAAASAAAMAETTAQAADTLAASAIPSSELGAASGVAELDATGHVPAAELPASSGGVGAPNAYVVFQGFTVTSTGSFAANGPNILSSSNVASVDDVDGEGLWQINLSSPAPSANFAVAAFGKFDVAADDGTLAIIAETRRLMPGAPSATAADVPTSTPSYLQLRATYQGGSTSPSSYLSIFLYRVSIWFTS